jgi:hypothetical protein
MITHQFLCLLVGLRSQCWYHRQCYDPLCGVGIEKLVRIDPPLAVQHLRKTRQGFGLGAVQAPHVSVYGNSLGKDNWRNTMQTQIPFLNIELLRDMLELKHPEGYVTWPIRRCGGGCSNIWLIRF